MVEETQDVSEGQNLRDVADGAYNERLHRYQGPHFRQAVDKTEDQINADPNEKHLRPRQRREKAAAIITHTFDAARASTPEVLTAVASDVKLGDQAEGSALHTFARDVAQNMETSTPSDGTFGLIDFVALLPVIMNAITGFLPLLGMCPKKPVTPTPTPVPA